MHRIPSLSLLPMNGIMVMAGKKQLSHLPYTRKNKFWPSIGRVNNTYGDRNLVCTCEPVTSYAETVNA